MVFHVQMKDYAASLMPRSCEMYLYKSLYLSTLLGLFLWTQNNTFFFLLFLFLFLA